MRPEPDLPAVESRIEGGSQVIIRSPLRGADPSILSRAWCASIDPGDRPGPGFVLLQAGESWRGSPVRWTFGARFKLHQLGWITIHGFATSRLAEPEHIFEIWEWTWV